MINKDDLLGEVVQKRFLRKENNKARAQTEKMTDLRNQNNRLVEANASAEASDNLKKQKNNIAGYTVKLEENLTKWESQNNQLKADIANRTAYYEAETKIRAEYEKATEQIVELLEQKCDDHQLLKKATSAQLQCEALASHKQLSVNPALTESNVSDPNRVSGLQKYE